MTATTTKHVLAVKGLDGTLKVNCPHTNTYWIHDDAASCKICRQCHLVIDYALWETTTAGRKEGHDGRQS